MNGNPHLEAFARAFGTALDDDLQVSREDVRIAVSIHYPSATASIKVRVGVWNARTFILTAIGDKLELAEGRRILSRGDRLLVLAKKMDKPKPSSLSEEIRALVDLFRQVEGDPNSTNSFVLIE